MSKQIHVESWRRRTRQKLMYAFGGKCGICGYAKCMSALHLHHLNPNTKKFSIGKSLKNNPSWERILNEAKKCVLLCSNCHCEVHERIISIPENIQKFNKNLIIETDLFDYCPICGKRKRIDNEYCSRKCAGVNNAKHKKIDWDSIDVIGMYNDFKSYKEVGLKIGCSGASVRKRILKIKNKSN